MNTPAPEHNDRPVVVPGNRIFLSTVQRADLPLYTRWFSDLEVTAYLGMSGRVFLPEQEQEWYENLLRAEHSKTFAIIVRDSQRVIGNVSLNSINHQHQVAELGIAIGDRSMWGQGYGTEATRLMTEYGFVFLNLETIFLRVLGFNTRAQRAYLKAGYREAGRLRGMRVFAGKRYDDILMDITRADIGQSPLQTLLGQADFE
jgi:RimJ/RimL family protein N-acetyltransferase